MKSYIASEGRSDRAQIKRIEAQRQADDDHIRKQMLRMAGWRFELRGSLWILTHCDLFPHRELVHRSLECAAGEAMREMRRMAWMGQEAYAIVKGKHGGGMK